jgi:hypothetical protein
VSDFDFHTLAINIDQPLSEYTEMQTPLLGLHLYAIVSGDRGKVLQFRHEHAHFASFTASGLADLQGIFSDYRWAFLHALMRDCNKTRKDNRSMIPVINDCNYDDLSDLDRIVLTAWRQIDTQVAYFMGFNANTSVRDLVDFEPQEAFWGWFFDSPYTGFVKNYHDLVSGLAKALALRHLDQDRAAPLVRLRNRDLTISSRSVMEAYALTIEALNTHFRGVTTSLTYNDRPLRTPGPLYTLAIEYALDNAGFAGTDAVQDYFAGKLPLNIYYTIAALSFASMQIPFLLKPDGHFSADADLRLLCPGHRFVRMIEALTDGRLSAFPEGSRSKIPLYAWLRACHESIGDGMTMDIYEAVHSEVERDAKLKRSLENAHKSIIHLCFAARENFVADPNEFVLDAGLFVGKYPCQVRFVRTIDGRLVYEAFGEDELQQFRARWTDDHSMPVLTAACFTKSWHATWSRMPEIAEDERLGAIQTAYTYTSAMFSIDTDVIKPRDFVLAERF